jgi:palmitoyl-protein thioesterase
MGVSYYPNMPRETWTGYILGAVINRLAYLNIAQRFVAPCDYWRVPYNEEGYLKYAQFLPDANNERNFDQARKDKWLALKQVIFVKWEEDSTIIPRESSWWGIYTEDFNIVSRFDTETYQKDLIGIKTLEEDGRATFIEIPGNHMAYTYPQINEIVQEPFSK